MKSYLSGERQKWINLGLFTFSLVPLVFYFFCVIQRIQMPFALEWGESAGINQILQLLSGERLYDAPNLEFTPLVYTPFYYWLASILGRVLGQVVFSSRLISVIASIGATVVIVWLVREETQNALAGWLAGAVYLGCFSLSGGFYDLVRVDSLYIFLLLITLAVMRETTRFGGMAVTGLLIALGFYIKQSALIVFFPLVAAYLFRSWEKSWPLIAATLLGIFLPFVWLNSSSDGWFAYYIFQLPREHGYSIIDAVKFWVADLLRPLGIAIGFGFLSILSIKNGDIPFKGEDAGDNGPEKDFFSRDVFYALFAVGAVGAAWITRSSNGGGANNVMSAYAAVSLLFGLGFGKAYGLINEEGGHRDAYKMIIPILAAMQLLVLTYNPFDYIPTAAEVEANALLFSRIEEVEGSVWVPYQSHLNRLAGKPPTIHAVNLFEMTGYFKGDVLPEGIEIVNGIRKNICNQTYGLIVLDQPVPWALDQISYAYQMDYEFTYMDRERRSALLDWQGGFKAVYLPRLDYDLNACMNTISSDRTD